MIGENRHRRPAAVYSVGEEPDVRFSLANERTALAWVRTALALVVGGVTLTTLAGLTRATIVVHVVAIIACGTGGALAVAALWSWRRNERALRLNQPLPAPLPLPWLVGGVCALSVGLVVFGVAATLHRL
ncbi:YidH family protein [Rhodococcus sp. NPDC127530]|uniref:YidH family protein n=1 Tax=unclassified Rhodococcus (in: high G+C Gram-positive bacteria) TaxID=192944 RepID=UPI0036281B00